MVLELDAGNEKAWFRHGQACFRLKDFSTALHSFKKVTENGRKSHGIPTLDQTEGSIRVGVFLNFFFLEYHVILFLNFFGQNVQKFVIWAIF